MSTLGERLKELRGPVSQAQMARELGMKQPQYARYESGASSPSADIIVKLCDVFCCSADDILGTRRHSASPINVRGNGNAIANGPHAKASVVTQTLNCKTCPYKRWGEKLRKDGLKIKGLPD